MLAFLTSIACALLMFAGASEIEGVPGAVSAGAAGGIFLYSLLTLTAAERDFAGYRGCPGDLFVSLVIPVYNEDPGLLRRGLQTVSGQTRPPDRVWIIDDGSSSPECSEIARKWAEEQGGRATDVRLVKKRHNEGKRSALVHAFENDDDADVFFTMDSDTLLDRDAVEEGLRPFSDPEVQGVAGLLYGHNRNHSVLTRLVEFEFASGFLVNRAAMSRFGAVLVTCGSLAAYRGDVCRGHRRDLLNEYFMGSKVLNGDDRKLTQFALQRGKVVLQESCIGRVALPETIGHLFRQRTRWSTSFYRGTVYMLRNMPPRRIAFWFSLAHAAIFGLETLALAGSIVFGAAIGWLNLATMLTAALLPGIVSRHRAYWGSTGVDRSAAGIIEYLCLSPAALVLSLSVVVPARYFALLHLRSRDWRTRQHVEAVTLARDEKNRGDEIHPSAGSSSSKR